MRYEAPYCVAADACAAGHVKTNVTLFAGVELLGEVRRRVERGVAKIAVEAHVEGQHRNRAVGLVLHRGVNGKTGGRWSGVARRDADRQPLRIRCAAG